MVSATRQQIRWMSLLLSGASSLLLLWFTIHTFSAVQAKPPHAAEPQTASGGQLLAIYILAYDNPVSATINLTPKYTATVAGIVAATANRPDVTAVILADLDAADDSHIWVAQNGLATPITGLPDSTGLLQTGLTEYDTTDGNTLGGFLLWARANFTATATLLSYIGHGTAVAPYTQPPIAQIIGQPVARQTAVGFVPMPLNLDANPDFTDHHTPSPPANRVLTIHDLDVALNKATQNGQSPFQVVDLVHCFAASIEELSQIAAYALTTTAAPNYAFFHPSMPGEVLQTLSPTQTAQEMATHIVTKYHAIIPAEGHPHVLTAVDNAQLRFIPMAWGQATQAMLDSFAQLPTETANALLSGYNDPASIYYDTPFCGTTPDYTLASPDQLSDLRQYATQLAQTFQPISSNTASAISNTLPFINGAIITTLVESGSPWFYAGPAPAPYWNFDNASGLSIFTPFKPYDNSLYIYHTWQALWYTDSYTIATGIPNIGDVTNPYPYSFIIPSAVGTQWAKVLAHYWAATNTRPGLDIDTGFCLPYLSLVENRAYLPMALQQTGQP